MLKLDAEKTTGSLDSGAGGPVVGERQVSNRKSYGNPFGRRPKDPVAEAAADAKLAHVEIVAGLEWLERGQIDIAVDRLHLAYRFLGEVLVRHDRIEAPEPEDDEEID